MAALIVISWKPNMLLHRGKRAFVEEHIRQNAWWFPSWAVSIYVTDPPHSTSWGDTRRHCDIDVYDPEGNSINVHVVVPEWPPDLQVGKRKKKQHKLKKLNARR
ncbi:hypothetical protein EUX98_g8678 [Antrodiella citrinella]|uniref:Uncharacterized protein n=1 Tax=Antrodiella citrinella TaxID=2447956 RepID=A0A4S4M5N3_9APHY|nr:hypothetical protein EUX98_g8678 [Antrodiella citrinella]